MIDSTRFVEGMLQNSRFRIALPYISGDVLDFGGNKGELGKYVQGEYTVVNYDHSPMEHKTFDTIVALAVIEHIQVEDIYNLFRIFKSKLRPGGKIVLTTPGKLAKPFILLQAAAGLGDKANIAEHKHYWDRTELYDLADRAGFVVEKYQKFNLANQLVVFKHR